MATPSQQNRLFVLALGIILTALGNPQGRGAEEPIFSGPQAGEKLAPFQVRGVSPNEKGKMIDPVAVANDGPMLVVFVHDVNRQAFSMTRAVTTYGHKQRERGLKTWIVLLHEDATEAEQIYQRSGHALTKDVVTAVSVDGKEGPGILGLNRNVMLTVIVAKQGKVVANFAMIQPSLQVDLPKVANSIAECLGIAAPSHAELLAEVTAPGAIMRAGNTPAPVDMRPLLTPLIRRDAKEEDVDRIGKSLEERADKEKEIAKELGRIASTIVRAGKLQDYGTPRAQEFLARWAEKYGTEKPQPNNSAAPKRDASAPQVTPPPQAPPRPQNDIK